MKRRIVTAGGSGLVGKQVVAILGQQNDVELHVLLRSSPVTLPDGVRVHIAPPENWPDLVQQIHPETAISCLGTTLKAAGSRDAFRAVDYDLLLDFAGSAKQAGARHMISVSSVGAMPASSSFYLRTKAEAEEGLRALGFDRLDIIRPGLLTGGQRKESRTGEAIAILLAPFTDLLMMGPLRKYASTPSEKVARAIASLASMGGEGQFVHENESIFALAG
jgi:uncharacterized protein YbjT (DUF2867 family)